MGTKSSRTQNSPTTSSGGPSSPRPRPPLPPRPPKRPPLPGDLPPKPLPRPPKLIFVVSWRLWRSSACERLPVHKAKKKNGALCMTRGTVDGRATCEGQTKFGKSEDTGDVTSELLERIRLLCVIGDQLLLPSLLSIHHFHFLTTPIPRITLP